MEENTGILKGIAAYERVHCDWNFFLDDQAVSVTDPSWLFRKQWDGVICRHPSTTIIEDCIRRGIPCVDLEDSVATSSEVPKIRPDNHAVGHVGAEHFLDRAFKHFGFCGFSSEDWAKERYHGFREALEAVNTECHALQTIYPKELTPEWDILEQEGIRSWVEALPKPVAIMACNDLRALQVISAVHEVGLEIPQEVAVLGANNETVRAEISHPPLSSVPLNTHSWGYTAAQSLHRQFEGEPFESEVFIEPLEVVVRRSTDALAIEDESILRAMQIIHDEACGSLRVEDLAKRVSVSRSLLERRFRKFLRRTPQEEIRNVKINRTKQLLIDTDKTLAEIADETGFEHPEYLSVMFKRLTGESPRAFRQRSRVAT